MGKKLEFGGSVSDNDKVNGISEKDRKIDIDESTPEEKAEQDKYLKAMTDGNTADNPGGSDDPDNPDEGEDEEEEESETDEEESDEDDSDEDEEDESDESDEEGSDEEGESESDADDSKGQKAEDEDNDKKTGQFDGYDTFEEYKAAQAEKGKPDSDDKKEVFDSLSDEEKAAVQHKQVLEFFKSKSDVISDKTVENYKKFYESSNNAFIHLDSDLFKLTKEMENLNPNLSIKEKMEKAFIIVFHDRIKKLEQKKAEAKTEAKIQKVNKSASSSLGGSSAKSGDSYSPETLKIMDAWGLKPKKKK